MSEQTKIETINKHISPLIDKALKMGVVMTVITVDIKPEPGQKHGLGGLNSCLEKTELIALLEDTLTNLKATNEPD